MKWEKVAIEDLCIKVISGGTPLRSRTEFYDGGSIPWIKTKEVNFNRIYDADEKITEKGLDNIHHKFYLNLNTKKTLKISKLWQRCLHKFCTM